MSEKRPNQFVIRGKGSNLPLLQSSVQLKVEPFTPKELALVKKANARHHETFMQYGIDMGWWKGLDKHGEPIPVDIIVKRSDLPKHWDSMAYVMWDQRFFQSIREAARRGWNIPLVNGSYYFGIKNQTIILTD